MRAEPQRPCAHGAVAALCFLFAVAAPPQKAAASDHPMGLPAAAIPSLYEEIWLLELGHLLSAEERRVFRSLPTTDARAQFRDEFWRVRDPAPGAAINAAREHYRHRIRGARSRHLAPDDDRFQVLARLGYPLALDWDGRCGTAAGAQREVINCVVERGFELFAYGNRLPDGVREILFLQDDAGRCRLYDEEVTVFQPQILTPQICPRRDPTFLPRLTEATKRTPTWQLIEEHSIHENADDRWLDDFEPRATYTDPSQQPSLHLTKLTEHAGSDDSTATSWTVDGYVRIPVPTDWWRNDLPWRTLFLRLDVFSGDSLVALGDTWQTQYYPPAGAVEVPWQMRFGRGAYVVVATVEEETGGSLRQVGAWTLDVPQQPDVSRASDPSAPRRENAKPFFLLEPLEGLRVGEHEVVVRTWSDDIASVTLLQDGNVVARLDKPPLRATVDFGRTPIESRLRARALTASGELISEQEMRVNAGMHRFQLDVQLVPNKEEVIVAGHLIAPAGTTIDRVEIRERDEVVETFHTSEFLYRRNRTAREKRPGQPTLIEATARLSDGRQKSTTLLVTEGASEVVDVDLVELYAGIHNRRGQPIRSVDIGDIEVREDGRRQEIKTLRHLSELPVTVALLLDTSDTMWEEIVDLRNASRQFLRQVLDEDDQAAIISLKHLNFLVSPLTNDLVALEEASQAVRAWGATRLHDGLALSLYYLMGLEGRRAVVVVSDGSDFGSNLDFEESLDYAERTGVAVYVIGLGLKTLRADLRTTARQRMRELTRRTGGQLFEIAGGRDLQRVFRSIEEDLRAQYLIAYETDASATSTGYRGVDVKVRGAKVSTRPGYYP